MTKKSHSFCMGAMTPGDEENWRVTAVNLVEASLDPDLEVMVGRMARGRSEVDSLTDSMGESDAEEGRKEGRFSRRI